MVTPKNTPKGEIDELRASQSAAAVNNATGLLASLGSNTDKNQTNMDFFFGAGSSLSSVKTINSARLGIESRARTLLAEIRMDQLRGVDTSQKREQLDNLTGNLTVMNKNLGNNIDKAMAEPKAKEAKPAIIDKINAGLKVVQEKEEKRVQDKYGKREAPEPIGENPEPEATTGTEDK